MRIQPSLTHIARPVRHTANTHGESRAHAHHHHCASCEQAHAGAAHASAHARPAGRAPGNTVHMRMYMGTWAKDGKIHALASNADFTVKAGRPVTLVVSNADDDMTHSFTSPTFGIDEKLPPAKHGKPTVRTITFTPKKAGRFEWYCSVPCDPKAMATDGMMRGTITVEQ